MKIACLVLIVFGGVVALILFGIQALGGGPVVYPHLGPALP